MDNEIFSKNKRQRWVIKIGSSLLTNKVGGIDKLYMAGWVRQMATLQEWGVDIVLVSSGAVAAGMGELKLSKRPTALPYLQATASIGQMKLAQTYKSEFNKHGVRIGQILLTHAELFTALRLGGDCLSPQDCKVLVRSPVQLQRVRHLGSVNPESTGKVRLSRRRE